MIPICSIYRMCPSHHKFPLIPLSFSIISCCHSITALVKNLSKTVNIKENFRKMQILPFVSIQKRLLPTILFAEQQPLFSDYLSDTHKLIIFTFSRSFRFFLTTNTWFLVMLSLTDLLLNACFGTATFKSTQSTI